MEYKIKITETLFRVITVNAEDEQLAVDWVSEQYGKGNIILDGNDFDCADIEAL